MGQGWAHGSECADVCDSLGGGLGGHTWVAGPNKTTCLTTIDMNSDANFMYLLNAQGGVLRNFSSPLVFDSTEWSTAANAFITSTILNEAIAFAQVRVFRCIVRQVAHVPRAQVNFNGLAHITSKFALNSQFYTQVLGVTSIDPQGNLYSYAASDSSQQVSNARMLQIRSC